MVINEEAGWFSRGGVALHRRAWLPNAPRRGSVVVVHGLCEHSGRYARFGARLAASGFAVHAMDNRGHGLSGGQRVNVDRFDDYLDDLEEFLLRTRASAADEKVFVAGHSLGGLIALAYCLRSPAAPLRGLVLSAPAACVPARVSPLTVFAGRILARLAPDLPVVSLPLDKISRDMSVVAAYENDPLVFRSRLRARLGAEMLREIRDVQARAHLLTLPLLIMQGGEDRLVDPSCSATLYGRLTSADKCLRVYTGLWHEIFNEPEGEEVLDELSKWLLDRV